MIEMLKCSTPQASIFNKTIIIWPGNDKDQGDCDDRIRIEWPRCHSFRADLLGSWGAGRRASWSRVRKRNNNKWKSARTNFTEYIYSYKCTVLSAQMIRVGEWWINDPRGTIASHGCPSNHLQDALFKNPRTYDSPETTSRLYLLDINPRSPGTSATQNTFWSPQIIGCSNEVATFTSSISNLSLNSKRKDNLRDV